MEFSKTGFNRSTPVSRFHYGMSAATPLESGQNQHDPFENFTFDPGHTYRVITSDASKKPAYFSKTSHNLNHPIIRMKSGRYYEILKRMDETELQSHESLKVPRHQITKANAKTMISRMLKTDEGGAVDILNYLLKKEILTLSDDLLEVAPGYKTAKQFDFSDMLPGFDTAEGKKGIRRFLRELQKTPLGKGTSGDVFLAREIIVNKKEKRIYTGEIRALKVGTGDSQINRMKQEKEFRRAAGTIASTRILDDGEITSAKGVKRYYQLYDVYAGGDGRKVLGKLINGQLSPDNFKILEFHIARQLLKRFARIHHEKGVFHRDAKWENIIFDKNGGLKIIDFETASKEKELKILIGSPPLSMAPEVYDLPRTGAGGDAEAADRWSVGIMILQLFSKNPNFIRSSGEMGQNLKYIFFEFAPKFGLTPDQVALAPASAREKLFAALDGVKNYLMEQISSLGKTAILGDISELRGNTLLEVGLKLAHPDPSKRISFKEALELPYFKQKVSRKSYESLFFNNIGSK